MTGVRIGGGGDAGAGGDHVRAQGGDGRLRASGRGLEGAGPLAPGPRPAGRASAVCGARLPTEGLTLHGPPSRCCCPSFCREDKGSGEHKCGREDSEPQSQSSPTEGHLARTCDLRSHLALPRAPGTHLPALAPPDAIDSLGRCDGHHGGRAGDTVAPRGDNDGAHGHALRCAGGGAVVGGWRGHGG